MQAVLHCDRPVAHTYRPMADACLQAGAHYLDITGETAVFESLRARSAAAQAANVMLLPGVGFDVVPSDCLAAHLKRCLPAATMAENLDRGGAIRRGGVLRPVPAVWRTSAPPPRTAQLHQSAEDPTAARPRMT